MSKVLAIARRHAVAFAALFLLMGSSAYAVVADGSARTSGGRIYACVTHDYGTLNLTTAARTCPSGQHKISWTTGSGTGARGAPGARGRTGSRGATGPVGATGIQGATGAAGAPGATGVAGSNGVDGAPGATGPAGPVGSTGPAGPDGAPGPAGPVGDTGPTGPVGDTGPIGETGPIGSTGQTGPVGPRGPADYAEFYALSPPDNPATISPGAPLEFPQDGPTSGGAISRISNDHVDLLTPGTYRVSFTASVSEAAQLAIALSDIVVPWSVTGRATGTGLIGGEAIVDTGQFDTALDVVNVSAGAITITPFAGGSNPVVADLVIEKLR